MAAAAAAPQLPAAPPLTDTRKWDGLLRALGDVRNELLCGVCYGRNRDPQSLGCCHLFCASCVDRMLRMTDVKCPLCRIPFSRRDVRTNTQWKKLVAAFDRLEAELHDVSGGLVEIVAATQRPATEEEVSRRLREQMAPKRKSTADSSSSRRRSRSSRTDESRESFEAPAAAGIPDTSSSAVAAAVAVGAAAAAGGGAASAGVSGAVAPVPIEEDPGSGPDLPPDADPRRPVPVRTLTLPEHIVPRGAPPSRAGGASHSSSARGSGPLDADSGDTSTQTVQDLFRQLEHMQQERSRLMQPPPVRPPRRTSREAVAAPAAAVVEPPLASVSSAAAAGRAVGAEVQTRAPSPSMTAAAAAPAVFARVAQSASLDLGFAPQGTATEHGPATPPLVSTPQPADAGPAAAAAAAGAHRTSQVPESPTSPGGARRHPRTPPSVAARRLHRTQRAPAARLALPPPPAQTGPAAEQPSALVPAPVATLPPATAVSSPATGTAAGTAGSTRVTGKKRQRVSAADLALIQANQMSPDTRVRATRRSVFQAAVTAPRSAPVAARTGTASPLPASASSATAAVAAAVGAAPPVVAPRTEPSDAHSTGAMLLAGPEPGAAPAQAAAAGPRPEAAAGALPPAAGPPAAASAAAAPELAPPQAAAATAPAPTTAPAPAASSALDENAVSVESQSLVSSPPAAALVPRAALAPESPIAPRALPTAAAAEPVSGPAMAVAVPTEPPAPAVAPAVAAAVEAESVPKRVRSQTPDDASLACLFPETAESPLSADTAPRTHNSGSGSGSGTAVPPAMGRPATGLPALSTAARPAQVAAPPPPPPPPPAPAAPLVPLAPTTPPPAATALSRVPITPPQPGTTPAAALGTSARAAPLPPATPPPPLSTPRAAAPGQTPAAFRMAVAVSPRAPSALAPGAAMPVLLPTSLTPHWRHRLLEAVRTLGGRVAGESDADATHVVCEANDAGLARRTIKYLLGVARGLWIVRAQWLEESLREGRWLDPTRFAVRGDMTRQGGPDRGRTRALLGAPPLLDAYRVVLFGAFETPNQQQAEQLVLAAGAQLVPLPAAASAAAAPTAARGLPPKQLLLCASGVDVAEAEAVSRRVRMPALRFEWLMDSLSGYAEQPFDAYLLCR